MGNELLTQVGNVSTAPTTINPALTQGMGFNNNIAGSLFNAGMNGRNYENDMMMPDWLKTGALTDEQRASIFGQMNVPVQQNPQQIQHPLQTRYSQQVQYPLTPQQQANQPVFSGQQNPQQYTQEQLEQYYNELLAQNPNLRITEKGNLYEKTNASKKVGILAGLGTALSSGIIKLFKGETLSKAFNLKSLAIKLPIFCVAGWAIGSVIDSFINSAKAEKADAQTQKV